MIELVKKSSGAVELDKHATQIITTKYVDEQIDKVEADIAALDKKTAQKDKYLENTINDIKNQVFDNTEDMATQLENINNTLFDNVLPHYEKLIDENHVAIQETQESVDALSEEVAADIVALENEVEEINNILPTIGGKNEFELILSGETTEALQQFKFNKEKGYNFELCDFIWIYVEVPNTSTKTVRLSVWLNNALIQVNNGIYKEQARANKIICFYNGLGWDFLSGTCTLDTEYAAAQTKMKAFYEYDNNISEITIGCYNKGDILPANTKYLIYGRRVKK